MSRMMLLGALTGLIALSVVTDAISLPLPINKYDYMEARTELKRMDHRFEKTASLNYKEKTVNLYLEKYKRDEFKNTSSYFYPARPIETELDAIRSRPLFKLLQQLPKGGNLHMHEFQMLDRVELLELVKTLPEYDYLHICDKLNNPDCVKNPSACKCSDYYLRYFAKQPAPEGWVKVKGSSWTTQAIANKTTLVGILNNMDTKIYPTDSGGRWKVSYDYGVFNFYEELLAYNNTRFKYMTACLNSALNENVQILEFRRANFGTTFYFNANGEEVKISAFDELSMLAEYKRQYIQQNPALIDFVFLIYGLRAQSIASVEENMRESFQTQVDFPELIRGYDVVGEEDRGHTLLFHSDTWVEGFKYMQKSNRTYNFFFHAAETNWPADYLPATYGDDEATVNNLYDSVLLKTHRIGHGLGLIKHPQLYPFIKKNKIAIEICPASNQILGYVPDLRNHPAINYYRSGIPIVLAGDDPGSFGYNVLTVDYYLAYMAWGLNLADLKDIANNSVHYSSIPENIRTIGYAKFEKSWSKFVNDFYSMACAESYQGPAINVSNVQPEYGPNYKTSHISLYGYNFEQAFCKNITCMFGNVSSDCELVSINEIVCTTPLGFHSNKTVPLLLQIGENKFNINLNYTFYSSIFLDQPSVNHSTSFNTNYLYLLVIVYQIFFITGFRKVFDFAFV